MADMTKVQEDRLLHQAQEALKGTEVLISGSYTSSREEHLAALKTFFESGARICQKLIRMLDRGVE